MVAFFVFCGSGGDNNLEDRLGIQSIVAQVQLGELARRKDVQQRRAVCDAVVVQF